MNASLHVNRRLLVSLCALLALTITWSPGIAGASQATPTDSLGSHTTAAGSEVTWNAPWIFNEERSFIDDSDQFQMLQFDYDTFVTMVVHGNIQDIEEAVGIFQGYVGGIPEAGETIDGGPGDPVSYWLDLLPVNDEPHGSFTLARTSDDAVVTMTIFLAPVDSFADGFASAQASIAIDGVPVFDGADGTGLQELLVAAAPADETANDRESGSKSGGYDVSSNSESWTDPTFGYDVTWSEGWAADSQEAGELVLIATDGSVYMNLSAAASSGATTADLAEIMSGALEELGVEVGPAATYLDENNLILAGELDGAIIIQEVLMIDGGANMILVTVAIGAGTDLDDAISFYRDSVLISDTVPLDGWDTITL